MEEDDISFGFWDLKLHIRKRKRKTNLYTRVNNHLPPSSYKPHIQIHLPRSCKIRSVSIFKISMLIWKMEDEPVSLIFFLYVVVLSHLIIVFIPF